MRFPYIEVQSNAEKFIERKMTPAAATPATPARAPQPVTVQGGGPGNGSSGQPAPQRKPPQSAPRPVQKKQEQEQQPAAVNEQHPFFE
jgi:hypothetical protein